jgi:hypothetical protein
MKIRGALSHRKLGSTRQKKFYRFLKTLRPTTTPVLQLQTQRSFVGLAPDYFGRAKFAIVLAPNLFSKFSRKRSVAGYIFT